MSEENKAFIRKYVGIYNDHDLDAFKELYADDCIAHTLRGDLDKERILQNAESTFAAFPDLQAVEDSIVAERDRVMARYTFRGTHRGDYRGTAATGKRVEWTAMVEFRVASGKIAESWAIGDRLGMMQQIGAIPS
jgi:steroid delta-isomerase-like uncharacterized protein